MQKRISSQNNVGLSPFSPLEQVCMRSLVNKGFTYKLKADRKVLPHQFMLMKKNT